MSKITPTSQFKSQYKIVKKNARWRPIFNGKVSFDPEAASPWDYIIDCFLTDKTIPEYFYVHPLHLPNKVIQQLKKRVPGQDVTFKILELHFDGHNGDHLLVYAQIVDQVYLVSIGTHSDLF
ncbi:replication associated protein [Oenococcus sicerae]|uniref:Replication associated protein n=1 Tax=Oenococcus sicerae TaxID=2203724 RepID=A0AAJ1VMK8_9LACO|nr:replication associated protein [Oenococcus sicerae]MDN6900668.1 replication associated protein [Oenococcus sicerae]